MIDSITTYLKIQERISKNYLNITEDSTDNLTGDKRLKARLGNLKVKQINENLYISGSQPKYLLNNNLDELTKKDIKLVNEKISDELKINYQYSRLYKIEIASNLIMNENVNYYFPCFGDLKNFVKGYIENTIYYGNSKKKITIYNKLKEMRAKKYFIPKKYKNIGDNILRYELRLKNRLLNEFGRKIYFFDLYDESFLQILLEKWKNYYFATILILVKWKN
ncbi:MAG: hypothetical protein NTU73_05915 [Ignavibacteriae bacterium]|nr:hypothetical protein [Ignavibacteriota bacterium]